MPRMMHHDKVVKLFIRALDGGAKRTGLNSCDWQIAGNCLNPYRTECYGRPRDPGTGPFHEGRNFTFTGGKMPMKVVLHTRCRKCEKCRKARSNEWRYRAREELRRAARSWFGTLTLSPVAQYRVLSEARAYAAKRSIAWNTLTDEERFKRVASTSLKEVTKYLKRVRKQSGVPLRYIVVTEQHKSGLPHFHVLMHEVELKPVTHRILSAQWTLGFEKWRLVPHDDLRGAGYIAKYLTKSDVAVRVRASQHYGKSIESSGIVLTIIRNGLNRSEQGEA